MIKCKLCNETGLVRIYNPWFITGLTRNRKRVDACGKRYKLWAKADDEWRLNIGPTCDIPCKCSKGNEHLIWYNRDGSIKLWNGRHEEQARFGDCWWHVRVLTVNETQTERLENRQHVEWILSQIPNSVTPSNPKQSQTEAEYFGAQQDPEDNPFAVALAGVDDPFTGDG